MSFSGNIKEELVNHYGKARHCNLAELSALTHMCGGIEEDNEGVCILTMHTENLAVARKCFTLLKKTFNIKADICVRKNAKRDNKTYFIQLRGKALKAVQKASLNAMCCKRAYIRGAFISAGSMSDPGKSYHFEVVCGTEQKAMQLKNTINSFGMDAKIVPRKKIFVVYLKEGSQIVDILNVMEAHVALMELENVRILKEMRNTVNRKVNCETANISKTVSAAVRQVEDITYIKGSVGFGKLPQGLKDVAFTRLKYPEATLQELGGLLECPVGKSGVNHRLRRLSEIAEKLREEQGGAL